MTIDIAKLMQTSVTPRTEKVAAAELAAFAEGDEAPVFVVRGLTGEELARVREAVERNRDMGALLENICGEREERVTAVRRVLGVSSDTVPDDLARRISLLSLGSLAPVLDEPAAIRIFEVCPLLGYSLTDTILRLTGEGAILGE